MLLSKNMTLVSCWGWKRKAVSRKTSLCSPESKDGEVSGPDDPGSMPEASTPVGPANPGSLIHSASTTMAARKF